jgi:SAM-dependent methyltransferase
MTAISLERIDEYACSMFRFERPHPAWIRLCADYIRHIFGDSLRGQTVIDYAFGRGNWSLAFLQAGAAKVIAIDASAGNVSRFADYCSFEGVSGVEILHADLVEEDIQADGDMVWLYGILHHIADAGGFLRKARSLSGNDGRFYIYLYNAESLRQWTVSLCRKHLRYESEAAFAKDAPLFSRTARLRARDDLTAPWIAWYTAEGVENLLAGANLRPVRQDAGLDEYITGRGSEEFSPYQLLCETGGGAEGEAIEVEPRVSPCRDEMTVLSRMAAALFGAEPDAGQRAKHAIGLFNTHFGALGPDGNNGQNKKIAEAVFEIFLHLAHGLIRSGTPVDGEVEKYLALVTDSMAGRGRDMYADMLPATIVRRRLMTENVRL